jgi:hypothetical protein
VTTYRHDCPPDLALLIHQMLEKVPDLRPAGAGAVSERLLAMKLRYMSRAGHGVTDLGRTTDFEVQTDF